MDPWINGTAFGSINTPPLSPHLTCIIGMYRLENHSSVTSGLELNSTAHADAQLHIMNLEDGVSNKCS